MDIKTTRRFTDGENRAMINVNNHHGGGYSRRTNSIICTYWLAGRCNRNPCRFKHGESPSLTYNQNMKHSHPDNRLNQSSNSLKTNLVSTSEDRGIGSGIRSTQKNKEKVTQNQASLTYNHNLKHSLPDNRLNQSLNSPKTSLLSTSKDIDVGSQKNQDRVCEYWVSSNCVHGDNCRYLHSWSRGDGFLRLTQLEGHKKTITGIALPSGSDKLYSGSSDGTVRVWDCNTGQCANIINLGGEVGSLISEGQWVFVGMPNGVKAWNIHTFADHSLSGPVGQVYAMVVGKDTLFAGVQDGTILVWKSGSEAKPFQLVASLKGHNGPVVSLAVGGNRLYSGSTDLTIKVWDIDTLDLECIQTLNGHSDVVMSLLCWDCYLLSCSLDGTIKVWVATDSGNLEVTYTHTEEHGVLELCGVHDADAKPILLCSCNDNSVRLYDLPSFSDRGRLFSKKEVRDPDRSRWPFFHWGWIWSGCCVEIDGRAAKCGGLVTEGRLLLYIKRPCKSFSYLFVSVMEDETMMVGKLVWGSIKLKTPLWHSYYTRQQEIVYMVGFIIIIVMISNKTYFLSRKVLASLIFINLMISYHCLPRKHLHSLCLCMARAVVFILFIFPFFFYGDLSVFE